MRLHHEIVGTGTAVLLTHGFAASSDMYSSTVPALSDRYAVVVWDMRGHGRSDAPDDPSQYSTAHSLADMGSLLDEAGGDRAVLVGHSLGGYLSLELALADPTRVAGLVLIDTGPGYRSDAGRDGWNRMAEQYAVDLETKGPGGLSGSAEVATAEHQGVAGLIHTARSTLRQEDGHVMQGLPTMTAPTLIVVGSGDEAFVAGSRYMASKIPRSRLAVIEGSGHAPPVTHPTEFNAVLSEFLAELT